MMEDGGARVSSGDPTANTDASQSRQRKKRKWDQPAEPLVATGIAFPVVPLGTVGTLVGNVLPGVASVTGGTLLTNPLMAGCTTVPFPVVQVAAVPQNATKPKIQDELIIAREIVINDAEPSVRYKLTKRQTQEEIQKFTGAVVITRGKFRQPNAPPDGEKPLYLHISAGAHLKDTAERILAVDRAAAMVEEMLKQGQNIQAAPLTLQSCLGNGVQALSTCVFLGFDADPSLNIAARIRGPNDQYIKHIMNETGANVLLKGWGAGSFESPNGAEGQEALHLFLSAGTSKSLEDAKRLAENLLDTIASECGASRVSSSNVYGAVPPPHLLLAGGPCHGNEHKDSTNQTAGLTLSTVSTLSTPASAVSLQGINTAFSQGAVPPPVGPVNCVQSPSNFVGYPQPLVTGGTSYSGYGGIYPQATPLQQVALALKQSSSVSSTVSPATSSASATTAPRISGNSNSEEKRHAQRRKFQELPASSKGSASTHKELETLKSVEKPLAETTASDQLAMPPPKILVQPSLNGVPPPPPQSMPPPAPVQSMPAPAPSRSMPPPPPPKFASSTPSKIDSKNNSLNDTKSDVVPVVSDTLVKLMEYGEEDDDTEETSEEPVSSGSGAAAVQKPFWAV